MSSAVNQHNNSTGGQKQPRNPNREVTTLTKHDQARVSAYHKRIGGTRAGALRDLIRTALKNEGL